MEWVLLGVIVLASIAFAILKAYFGLLLGTLAAMESHTDRRLLLVGLIYYLTTSVPGWGLYYFEILTLGWIRIVIETASFLILIPLLIYLSKFPPPKALLIAVYAKLLIFAFSFLNF